ncbi:PucR family transcriptional regulator [Couchioplanes caeruleus]|nr:PucR family transcriptional regulator [Couchioplanes caeruleus]ROP28981.1 PucR-like helix-turn-helix protein [Couchioplanes caeruleus]
MGDLFRLWRQQVTDNARRAVDAYQEELLEYRNLAGSPRGRSEMLDFAVFLRQRTVELAADGAPFPDDDLEFMAAMGRQRGEKGLTLTAQRQGLLLHTRLTLREVYEAAGPSDIDATMHTLAWLAPAGLAAQGAFTRGWIEGQQRTLSTVAQVRLLTVMLLADDKDAAELARGLHMSVPDHVLATVVRVAGGPPGPDQASRDEFASMLLKTHWAPLSWQDPHEVVALIPSAPGGQQAAADRVLALAREVAGMVGRPCAVGTAPGRVHAFGDAVALARQVSDVAPLRAVPRHAYAVTDVFAELGAARLAEVGQWLQAVAEQLTGGPDLVATLDAYYQHDMNRLRTAAALCIHPRTLDYRLARVRELTGLEPGSTRGVRVLSTAVARILASPLP